MKDKFEWLLATLMFFALGTTCFVFEGMMLVEGKAGGYLFLLFAVCGGAMFYKYGVKAMKRLLGKTR